MKRYTQVIPNSRNLLDLGQDCVTLAEAHHAFDDVLTKAAEAGATHLCWGFASGAIYPARQETDAAYIDRLEAEVAKLTERLRQVGRTGPEAFIREGGR